MRACARAGAVACGKRSKEQDDPPDEVRLVRRAVLHHGPVELLRGAPLRPPAKGGGAVRRAGQRNRPTPARVGGGPACSKQASSQPASAMRPRNVPRNVDTSTRQGARSGEQPRLKQWDAMVASLRGGAQLRPGAQRAAAVVGEVQKRRHALTTIRHYMWGSKMRACFDNYPSQSIGIKNAGML